MLKIYHDKSDRSDLSDLSDVSDKTVVSDCDLLFSCPQKDWGTGQTMAAMTMQRAVAAPVAIMASKARILTARL